MRSLALSMLLAIPAFAAERAPVPQRATAPQLQAAFDRCAKAAPEGDRCYDIQMALARALLPVDPKTALKLADAAYLVILSVQEAEENRIAPLQFRQRNGTIAPADLPDLARGEDRIRRYWLDMADTSELSGDAALAAGRIYREATSHYGRAASIRAEHGRGEGDRRARLRAAGKRAAVFTDSPSPDEGLPVIRAAHAEAKAAWGDADPLTVTLALTLADSLVQLGATGEAEPLYLDARERLARAPAATRLDADARYARLLTRMDRRQEAEALARDILTRLIAARADALQIARAYLDLATLVLPDEGLPMARQALALRTDRLGVKHLDSGRAQIVVARLLEARDDYAAAEPLRRESAYVLQSHLFMQHPETALAWLQYGENLFMQDKPKEALAALRSAEFAVRDSVGVTHPNYGRVLLFTGMVQLRQGNREAIATIEKALPIVRAGLATTHMDRVQAEFSYGMVKLALGEVNAARAQFRIVGQAGLDRAAAWRDFGTAAQREMRYFSTVFVLHVSAAWQTAQQQR